MTLPAGTTDSVRPYLHGVTDMAPKDLKYRFNWTSPIVVAPNDWKTVYLGGNVLFKSTDQGATWNPISPDLTRNDKSKQLPSGGPIQLDMSGAETFDTILSLAVSAADPNVIWVGTDDGLVQVTRDGGQTWANVTPPKVPEWGRAQQIEVSPFAPGTTTRSRTTSRTSSRPTTSARAGRRSRAAFQRTTRRASSARTRTGRGCWWSAPTPGCSPHTTRARTGRR
jgi:hypothetical protein